ncbi:MAG: phenylacetate--CoA ligase family protein [Chloroflexota bacterium]
MRLYPAFVRHVLAPGYDRVRGTSTMRRLAHLEKSQWWPLERIEEQQSRHLQDLIAHAYEHVPYYRRIMDEHDVAPADIRSASDLHKLPALTKAEVNANRADLLSRAVPPAQLTTGWSGGTTGERLNYHSTRQERLTYSYARWALTFEWPGVQLGEVHMSIRQQTRGPDTGLKQLGIRLQRLTKVDTMLIDEEHMDDIVQLIRQVRPRAVFSYPSALVLIASYVKSARVPVPRIDVMCLGGERLTERQREVLDEVFGGQQYVRYGSNELHEVAGQCEVCGGLHILAEDFIIEVVDDSGAPVAPGERGRFLITALHNYGMPFIRYENGDIGSLFEGSCPCGRGLPLLDVPIGRTREYMYSSRGARVDAMDVRVESLLPPGVVQWQLIQEDYERFMLRAVPVEQPVAKEWPRVEAQLSNLLKKRLDSPVSVEVQLVDHIEMNLSGKRLSFVSNIDGGASTEKSPPRPDVRPIGLA